jgi:signal transduction histidine kinase
MAKEKIWAESKEGQGSVFHFMVPLFTSSKMLEPL